ncbi:hypothetical protein B2A_00739, partial [mine drainage metagenome]
MQDMGGLLRVPSPESRVPGRKRMSAQPIAGSAPDHVNIEIDGHALRVPKGSMIIQAADKVGI